MTPHTCHAIRCQVAVPPRMAMCRAHWFSLPKSLRDLVWASYRRGQERDKRPSDRYVAVMRACQVFVADREGYLDVLPSIYTRLGLPVLDELGLTTGDAAPQQAGPARTSTPHQPSTPPARTSGRPPATRHATSPAASGPHAAPPPDADPPRQETTRQPHSRKGD